MLYQNWNLFKESIFHRIPLKLPTRMAGLYTSVHLIQTDLQPPDRLDAWQGGQSGRRPASDDQWSALWPSPPSEAPWERRLVADTYRARLGSQLGSVAGIWRGQSPALQSGLTRVPSPHRPETRMNVSFIIVSCRNCSSKWLIHICIVLNCTHNTSFI